MAWKFTHAADAAAKIVVQNALFFGPFGRKKLSALVMPWCTYTDPEVAHVGLYERDARGAGIAIDTYHVAAREGEPRRHRRRGGGLRQGPRAEGQRTGSSAPRSSRATPAS